MASFHGDPCKTAGCGGHRAGFRYATAGGRLFTKTSRSFNNGMRINMGWKIPKITRKKKK